MDVVDIERGEAFTSINRRDGRRVVTVSMDVEPKRAMTRVMEAIKTDVLPQIRAEYPGLTWTFQGTQAEMRESTQALWGRVCHGDGHCIYVTRHCIWQLCPALDCDGGDSVWDCGCCDRSYFARL